MIRLFSFFILFIVHQSLGAQIKSDPWILSQLSRVLWHQTYEGVLADYHPVMITLASDSNQIAGYLIHKGDQRVHRLLGDWTKKDLVQLQERDEYDRLTGYLKGSIKGDQLRLAAYPTSVIKIKNFKPAAEWIKVDINPELWISVQKMDFGIVSGIAKRNNEFSRFEGYCLDGTCSIWNTVLQNSSGAPIRVQMRQKDASIYKVVLDGKEYSASIRNTIPLGIRHFDNSMGFLDFVYPDLQSKSFHTWLSSWIDKSWDDGVAHLKAINQPATSGRLVHRSSGWMEIFDAGDNYVSGLITYINPGSTRRESFVWLKKEDLFLTGADLLNTPDDLKKACDLTLARTGKDHDEEYLSWLRGAGYGYLVPANAGLVMLTEFNSHLSKRNTGVTSAGNQPF